MSQVPWGQNNFLKCHVCLVNYQNIHSIIFKKIENNEVITGLEVKGEIFTNLPKRKEPGNRNWFVIITIRFIFCKIIRLSVYHRHKYRGEVKKERNKKSLQYSSFSIPLSPFTHIQKPVGQVNICSPFPHRLLSTL